MGYSIRFFALQADRVAHQMRSECEALLERVAEHVCQSYDDVEEDEVASARTRLAEVCKGDLPSDCDPEYFQAFAWLMEVVSEEVPIGSFIDFDWALMEEAGVWPWLLRSPPPFPVPVASDPAQQVGFLSIQDIEQIVPGAFEELPSVARAEVTYARHEFRDVLESLLEDELDLLALLA